MPRVCADHAGRIDPAYGSCRPLHIDYAAETLAMADADAREAAQKFGMDSPQFDAALAKVVALVAAKHA